MRFRLLGIYFATFFLVLITPYSYMTGFDTIGFYSGGGRGGSSIDLYIFVGF